MVTKLIEAAGITAVVAFFGLVWAPLALLTGGLVLVVWANTRPPKADTAPRRRLVAAFTAALDAGRQRWADQTDPADLGPRRRIRSA